MFICEKNEDIYMMGREKDFREPPDPENEAAEQEEEEEDERPSGVLRKVKKPKACKNIKKVGTGAEARMILTEDGKLFFSGNNENEIFKFKQDDTDADDEDNEEEKAKAGEDQEEEEYEDEDFKEVDLSKSFETYYYES